jgi:hypothetical protein
MYTSSFPHYVTAQAPAPGEICGHRCPNDPGWTPCQRPRGHDPEYGHRDSTGTDVRHVWQDHSRD